MAKQILVCLEGSASGQSAIDVAIGLGRELEATLVGLAIVDEPDIRAGAATGIGGSAFKVQRDEALLEDAHQHARAWCEAFATRCRDAGVLAITREQRGKPGQVILEESARNDLIMLGRHANFRFETNEHDPRTRDLVLRQAGKPVLMVPEAPIRGGSAVVVAYDGTPASVRAIRSLVASGLLRDRPVHVVSIGDSGSIAWEVATRGVALFDDLGVRATGHHVVSLSSVAEAILEQRDKLDAGLIVQGAYAHSRFSRLFWGSVTRDMLEKTVVPLFLHY
jgi:nucleotide-binding universal stress UspA family protein